MHLQKKTLSFHVDLTTLINNIKFRKEKFFIITETYNNFVLLHCPAFTTKVGKGAVTPYALTTLLFSFLVVFDALQL